MGSLLLLAQSTARASSQRGESKQDAVREEIERHLVALLCDAPEEIPEALEVAMRDPVAALQCFRLMATSALATNPAKQMPRGNDRVVR